MHSLAESHATNRDRFRPASVSRHPLTRERIVYPPAVCLLKFRNLTKAT